jgi:galactonate dehydratase
VAPHNPLGPIATAAAVHFALATPNWLIQEAIRSDVPWRDAVVGGGLPVKNGYILPPTPAGLGIEVDEREAAKMIVLPMLNCTMRSKERSSKM